MHRDRPRKSSSDSDRSNRTMSYHGDSFVRTEDAARQSAAAKQYRAALEALFEKKPEAAEKVEKLTGVVLPRVVESEPATDAPPPEATNKRQELLRKVYAAQGPKAVSEAVDAFLAAGHSFPDDQEVFLQMLEHRDEERVRDAIARLATLLVGQLPKRKPVLVQRLKRLEENADESETRDAATALRRKVA